MENSRCLRYVQRHSIQHSSFFYCNMLLLRATTCHLCTSQTKNNYHSLSHSSLVSICPFRRPKGRQKSDKKHHSNKKLFFLSCSYSLQQELEIYRRPPRKNSLWVKCTAVAALLDSLFPLCNPPRIIHPHSTSESSSSAHHHHLPTHICCKSRTQAKRGGGGGCLSLSLRSSLSPPSHPPTHTQPNIPSVAGSPAVASLFPAEEEVRITAQERAALPQEPFAEWALLAAVVCTNSTGLSPPSPTTRTRRPQFSFC